MSRTVDQQRRDEAQKELRNRVRWLLNLLVKVNDWRADGVPWPVIQERLGISKATAFRKRALLEELLERVEKNSQPGTRRG